MRIAMIDPSLYTVPYDVALLKSLVRCGHEVRLVGRAPRVTEIDHLQGSSVVVAFHRRSEALKGRYGPLATLGKGLEHLLDLRRLESEIAALAPDVVHWQWPSLPLLDARIIRTLARRWPQVVTVHDSRLFHATGVRALRAVGWLRFLKRADRLIVHLQATKNRLIEQGLDHASIDIIPHAILASKTKPEAAKGLRPKLRALFFGRVSRDKGADVLLEACRRRPAEIADRLEIIVAGPAKLSPADIAASLGGTPPPCLKLDLRFVPEQELDALLESADLVILPHRDIDASGVLMKALAFDTGFVAADLAAFRETLGDAGAARYFAVGDSAVLARVLEDLAHDPEQVMRLRGAARLVKRAHQTWDTIAAQTEACYCAARERRSRTS